MGKIERVSISSPKGSLKAQHKLAREALKPNIEL